jgi:N-acetylmuramoyl-L-alanine amidase
VKEMKINVHAGHGKDGSKSCGAVGLIKESTEARKVKDLVIKYLKSAKHTVYDCTVDTGKDASDILTKIVKKCNEHTVDLDVSIHFNAGVNDTKGNGKTTGTEVLIYSDTSKAKDEAKRVCDKLDKIGFKNRGVKVRTDLFYLKKTKAPSMLIEVCFTNDKDDVTIYKKNIDKISKSIAEAIINKSITTTSFKEYKVKVTAGALNVRKGAGTKHGIVDVLYKGDVVTIKKVSSGWGYIGKGYINLKYTKRV